MSKYEDLQARTEGSSASQLRRRPGPDGGAAGVGGKGSAGSKGSTLPPPDRVNVQLNSALVHARTADRILQVVEENEADFNAVNTITALHRLATVGIASKKGALRRDVRFKRLVHRLSDTLRNADSATLKPQDLSNVAWALTKLGLLNAVLFGHLSVHIMRTVETFEPVNLSMTLWAFARSGFLDEKLFQAAATEVKRQLPVFQPQQIANTTWAMAKSGFVDEELFNKAADLALAKLPEFQPMNYSMLVYSFALAKLPHAELFERVGQRCTVQELSTAASAPNVVANLALAFSEANLPDAQVFDALGTVGSITMNEFRSQQITTLVQAFAKVGIKHDKLFAAVNNVVLNRLYEFRVQDLQDIMNAFQSIGAPITSITRAVASHEWREDGQGNKTLNLSIAVAVLLLLALLAAWRLNPDSPD